jgi:hypothetical protein
VSRHSGRTWQGRDRKLRVDGRKSAGTAEYCKAIIGMFLLPPTLGRPGILEACRRVPRLGAGHDAGSALEYSRLHWVPLTSLCNFLPHPTLETTFLRDPDVRESGCLKVIGDAFALRAADHLDMSFLPRALQQ